MGFFSRKKKGKRGEVITIEEAEERGLYQAIKDGDPEKMDRMLERMTRKPKKDPPPTDKERADNE